MIAAVLAIAVLQQPTYFLQTFPNPSGNNGWEEYVMAVDVMEAGGGRVREEYRKNLASSRNVAKRFARVVELVKQGNRKPLRYPWSNDAFETDERHPMVSFGDVGLILTTHIGVEFASGNPNQAVDALTEALTFAQRTSSNQIIDALVSGVTYGYAFRELNDNLSRLSLSNARELVKVFDRYAQGEQPLIAALRSEFEMHKAAVPRFLNYIESDRDLHWDAPTQLASLTNEEKRRLVPLILSSLEQRQSKMLEMFQREERFWEHQSEEHEDPIVAYTLDYFSNELLPRIIIRYRTQFRLAALHCRIIEFKRTHNRWPERLEELGGRDAWYDPASGGPFFYAKLTDQSYTLYSLGTPETGRIDLVWRGPPQ